MPDGATMMVSEATMGVAVVPITVGAGVLVVVVTTWVSVAVMTDVGEIGNEVAVAGTGVADAAKTVGEGGIGVAEALIGVGEGNVGVRVGLAGTEVLEITTKVAVGLLFTGTVISTGIIPPWAFGLDGVKVGSAKVGMMMTGGAGGAALCDNPEIMK